VSLCANACADRSGTCGIPVHHALRASTAAPGYFETCVLDERPGERFQDGGLLANNPAALALHEAMRLWPTRNIDVLVSIGLLRCWCVCWCVLTVRLHRHGSRSVCTCGH
jgi:predicted acylesterase/phospholipase RssA